MPLRPAENHRSGYQLANLVVLSLTFVAAVAAAAFAGWLAIFVQQSVADGRAATGQQLRAYVMLKDVHLDTAGERRDGELIWHIAPEWENSSATPPTRDMVSMTGFQPDQSQSVGVVLPEFMCGTSPSYPSVLGPEGTLAGQVQELASRQMDAIGDDAMRLMGGGVAGRRTLPPWGRVMAVTPPGEGVMHID